jgi:thiol-disulfide isomerase/thioredoxin
MGVGVVRVGTAHAVLAGTGAVDLGQQPVAPGVGAGTQDPRKVLRVADEALRTVRSVSYEAAYQGTGAFATRSWITTGKVRAAKLAAGDPLTAKLAAEGQQFAAGADQPQAFHAAFDGRTIRRIHSQDSTLIEKTIETDPKERNLGTVTGFFGGGAYSLLMFEYLLDQPLARQADAPIVEYEGRAIVASVLCHVVYVEFAPRPDGRVRRERWFIGIKDNLPRQFETVVVDDKGRYGAYVLTLSNLRANPPLDALAFTIKPPVGYKIKAYEPPSRRTLLAVGDPAPDWKLMDAEGQTHSLADYRGQLVLLDFWATWCGPCVRGMPGIQKLHEKYGLRGVEIVGINAWEESNAAADMTEKGYTYRLLLKGEAVAEAYRATTLPTIYIVGVDGKIIYRSGFTEAENLALVIEQHLKEQGR